MTAADPNPRPFHVVTIGWGERTISELCDRVEQRSAVRFSHVVVSDRELRDLERRGRHGLFLLREHAAFTAATNDPAFLASLERDDLMTIHNMILSDRVLRHLEYDDAMSFASAMARGFAAAFQELAPSVVIGSFDNLHACLSHAVAKKLGIPWFALSFTPLPAGLTGFCPGLSPSTVVPVQEHRDADLRALAEQTLNAFVARATVVPVYTSTISVAEIARRFPAHVAAFVRQLRTQVGGEYDRYTEYPSGWLARQYVRKRWNVLRMPKHWFCDTPPAGPYLFYGLGMQPESSIEVWAPFYSDQFGVVEAIARSAPPTVPVLVKLHTADVDNYSYRDLDRLRRMPGVRLVSPFASSRAFIEGASLVLTIMGTMALEAALVGKPVLMFGESRVTLMPGVARVTSVTDLPAQVRSQLALARPSREAIIRGLMAYLRPYAPGCYNDWYAQLSDTHVDNFVSLFQSLRTFLEPSVTQPQHDDARV